MQIPKTKSGLKACAEITLVVLFLGGIYAPALLLLSRAKLADKPQQAAVATFPKVRFERATLKTFPRELKAYLRDNFGFRDSLIYWQAVLKHSGLKVSSSPQVILGKEGWLFYADEQSVSSLRNARLYTNDELAQWKQVLEARQQLLSQSGIKYLIAIAPDKHTIYPEYVPDSYTRVNKKSRREQLVEYLKGSADLQVLDLTEALRPAKGSGPLYFQTDTHWNMKGAFYAYQALGQVIQQWYPQFQPRPLAQFSFPEYTMSEGDLTRMLGLEGRLHEQAPSVIPQVAPKSQMADGKLGGSLALLGNEYPEHSIRVAQCPQPELAKAVVLHDSFTDALMFYLSEHFGQTVYLRGTYSSFPAAYLLQERPPVVIHEFVERTLAGPPPPLPETQP